MNEFEKESQTMDMKEEMMGDAVDDVMDDEAEGEGEEEEGDKILKEVLDEIGINTSQMVSSSGKAGHCPLANLQMILAARRNTVKQPAGSFFGNHSATRRRGYRHGGRLGSRLGRRSTLWPV